MPRFKRIDNVRVQFTAEEEAARDAEDETWAAGAFDRAIAGLRQQRNQLLAETDFYALSDVTMSSDMTTYRQALRDLPAGKDTVDKVENVTWPTKP